KVIRPDRVQDDESVRRFQREARAAARAAHPNIVTIFDTDLAAGKYYLAMEYVEGVTLSRLVRERGPLPVAVACDYARQAALGLQHAHERGLVHRDIKPGNLVLTQAQGAQAGGVVKILDLGLARLTDASESRETVSELTHTGMVMGTLDFI